MKTDSRAVVALFFALMCGCIGESMADEPSLAATQSASQPPSEPEPSESAALEHGYADSSGVKIHYVSQGAGPVVLMIHGFPDYWYTWRDQMAALAATRRVVAIDQRGFNMSGQPEGVENYAIEKLVGDVAAVLKHLKCERATIVGHDWGGAVAWSFAMQRPEMTERLVILNCPHPRGLYRELATNEQQRQNSQYARDFQQPDAASKLPIDFLVLWVKEVDERERYLAAFKRSSLEGMLNYYKANYPREPYEARDFPQIKCPTLVIHGLDDTALLPGALSGTWQWIDNELTIVTIPKAGHWVHRDATERVNKVIVSWLSPGGAGS